MHTEQISFGQMRQLLIEHSFYLKKNNNEHFNILNI